MVLAYPIVCFVFVPVYFSLGITSVYQYLDLRFKSRLVRCLASGTYIVRQLLNQGVTVFTPCVALNTIVGIPYWASIFGISIVSIIFTLLVSRYVPACLSSFGIVIKSFHLFCAINAAFGRSSCRSIKFRKAKCQSRLLTSAQTL